jgi:DNA-binding NarL/FixJ family response regulator
MIANDAGEPNPLADLTPQELRVVDLVVQSYTNRDIAANLRTAEDVVKHNLCSIFDKLGVSNRLELVMLVRRHRGQGPPG